MTIQHTAMKGINIRKSIFFSAVPISTEHFPISPKLNRNHCDHIIIPVSTNVHSCTLYYDQMTGIHPSESQRKPTVKLTVVLSRNGWPRHSDEVCLTITTETCIAYFTLLRKVIEHIFPGMYWPTACTQTMAPFLNLSHRKGKHRSYVVIHHSRNRFQGIFIFRSGSVDEPVLFWKSASDITVKNPFNINLWLWSKCHNSTDCYH